MSAEAQRAARQALEAFYAAWNARDLEPLRATMNYPHVTLAPGGEVTVRSGPAEFESPYERLAAEGWHRSTIDAAEVRWASAWQVCFDVTFSRYRADGERYYTGEIVYIVTEQDGHWGIQFRTRR